MLLLLFRMILREHGWLCKPATFVDQRQLCCSVVVETIEADEEGADGGREPKETGLVENIRFQHSILHGPNGLLLFEVVSVERGQVKI